MYVITLGRVLASFQVSTGEKVSYAGWVFVRQRESSTAVHGSCRRTTSYRSESARLGRSHGQGDFAYIGLEDSKGLFCVLVGAYSLSA